MKSGLLFILFCASLLAGVRNPNEPDLPGNKELFRYSIQKISKAPVIDGIPDADLWANAPKISIDYEIMPGDNLKAPQKTEAAVFYDNEKIYVCFFAHDTDPSKIRANLSERDRMYRDDFVAVMFDTYNDAQKSYMFLSNPFGIQGDLLRIGNNEDDSYDFVWQSAGKLTADGYFVEMAIPFSSLKFPDIDIQNWGMHVFRNYPRDSRYLLSWAKFDRNDPCFLCLEGSLNGITGIKVASRYELLPYTIGFQGGELNDSEDPNSGFNNKKFSGRAGLGIKYSPGSELTIDAVINPDFSQVESDAQQISVNSTFALFYPEKRPFFLEGTDLLNNLNGNAFYSRMINNPLYAAKVSGKADRVSYIWVSSYDRNSAFLIPGEEGSNFVSSDIKSFSNVLRAVYNFANDSYSGLYIGSRNMDAAHNLVGGLDWKYLFFKNWYFKGSAYLSNTKEVNNTDLFDNSRVFGKTGKNAAFNGENFSGTRVAMSIARSAREHEMYIEYSDASPLYQNQMGFNNKNNFRTLMMTQGYNIYFDSSFVNNLYFMTEVGTSFNHDNIRKERWIFSGFNINMKGQTGIFAGLLWLNEEIYKNIPFKIKPRLNVNFSAAPLSFFNAYGYFEIGEMMYRSDTPELGKGTNAGLTGVFKVSSSLSSEFSYNIARMSASDDNELFYDGYILRNSTNYQFTGQMQLRLITEYNSFDKSLSVFPLFNYKLNPFTMFYIGSTQNMRDFTGQNSFKPTSRQYFVKLQYLVGS